MPKTLIKTVTAYKFFELSPEAKKTALAKMADINVDYPEWYENYFDDYRTIGKIIGIDIEEIYFSGFSSQGDGACFDGHYEYAKNSVKKIKAYGPTDKKLHFIAENLFTLQKENRWRIGANIRHSGHYYHAFCTDIDVSLRDKDGYFNDYDDCSKEITEQTKILLRDFMNWIYRSLEKEYEYLTSEKSIIESIEANDYDFTIEGNFPAI